VIRSLRSRLILAVLAAIALLLAAFGFVVYQAVRWAMMEELDAALASTARTLAASVEHTKNQVDVEFEGDKLAQFEGGSRKAYYQFWLADGKVLKRSPSLGNRDLPRFGGRLDKPVPRTLTLPSGKPGRALGLTFLPRAEEEKSAAGPRVTLVIAQDTHDMRERLDLLAWLLAGAGAATMLTATLVAVLAVTRGLRPMRAMARNIDQIGPDDLAARVPTDSIPTELLPVGQKLNDMLARLEAAFQRERAFTSDVAHELRTPLAGMRTTVEVAMVKDRSGAEYCQTLADSLKILLRMQGMVESLLMLTRLDTGQIRIDPQAVNLAELTLDCWKEVAGKAQAKGIRLENHLAAGLRCRTDRQCMLLVLRNLLDNAVTYVEPGGWIRLDGRRNEELVELAIANTGCTLSPQEVEHVFDRFWRGDPSRTDTGLHCGLGLSLVQRAAAAIGGTVTAAIEEPRVFVARVTLPG